RRHTRSKRDWSSDVCSSDLSVFLGSVFYLLILLIGPLFLEIFYSAWSKESVLLLKYTAAASIVSVIANLFRPFNMRFNDLKWQLYINGSYLIIYITLTIMLTKQYGIIGFAIGVLIAARYNLVIQITVYYLNTKTFG